MASLSEIIRKKFLKTVSEIVDKSSWYIVVMDTDSYNLYNMVLPEEALLEHNILNIMKIEDVKTKMDPNVIAIYFLFSHNKNFLMLENQFPIKGDKPTFNKVHLFFLSVIPPNMFSHLGKRASKYWLSLQELNIDFYPMEANLFSLNLPDAFLINYSQSPAYFEKRAWLINKVAHKLFSLCITLGHNPKIRYSKYSLGSMSLNELISNKLRYELDDYIKDNSNFPPMNNPNKSVNGINPITHFQRPTLLILDRAIDLISPLLLNWNYKPLLKELHLLDEMKGFKNDKLFNMLKYQKLGDVEVEVKQQLNQFKNKVNENKRTATLDIKKIKELVINLTDFKKEKENLIKHYELLKKCKTNIKNKGYSEYFKLQQTILNNQVILDQHNLLEFLCDVQFNKYIKLRLILLLIVLKLRYETYELNLLKNINIEDLISMTGFNTFHLQVINNIKYLLNNIQPLSIQRELLDKQSNLQTILDELNLLPYINQIQQFLIDYIPKDIINIKKNIYPFNKIAQILLSFIEEELDLDFYPYVANDQPKINSNNKMLRVYQPKFTQGKRYQLKHIKRNQIQDLRQTLGAKYSSKFHTAFDLDKITEYHDKLIIFIVGGITYYEYNILNLICKNANLEFICGSTNIVDHSMFLVNLSELDSGGN